MHNDTLSRDSEASNDGKVGEIRAQPLKGGPDRCSVTRGWGGASPEGLKISTILASPASVRFGSGSGTKFGTCT